MSWPECTFQTAEAEASVVAVLLSIHASTVHTPQATASVSTPRGPKLDRPRVDSDIDEETWNAFIRRWDAFRLGSGITIGEAPRQLFHCASDALGDLILKSDPSITTRSLEEVRQLMKSLAVIPVSIGVIRAELSKMSQDADEQFRTFAAKVRGKAETCAFSTCVKCSCGLDIIADYTNEVIIDVLLAGIYDTDIRLKALSDRGLMKKTVNTSSHLLKAEKWPEMLYHHLLYLQFLPSRGTQSHNWQIRGHNHCKLNRQKPPRRKNQVLQIKLKLVHVLNVVWHLKSSHRMPEGGTRNYTNCAKIAGN